MYGKYGRVTESMYGKYGRVIESMYGNVGMSMNPCMEMGAGQRVHFTEMWVCQRVHIWKYIHITEWI